VLLAVSRRSPRPRQYSRGKLCGCRARIQWRR
jgi:hypothetical protein